MPKPGTKTKRGAVEPAVVETPPLDAEEPAIVQGLDAPSKWSGAIVAGGLMLVAGLSFFAVRGMARRKG